MRYSDVLLKLEHVVGETEYPPGSNHNRFADEVDKVWSLGFSRQNQQWCGTLMDWALTKALLPSSMFSVIYGMNHFKSAGRWSTTPRPGYLVFFSWTPNRVAGHVGWVKDVVSANTIDTIEGNTTPGVRGEQANGGGVYQRARTGPAILGYGIVDYEPEEGDSTLPYLMVKCPLYQNIWCLFPSGIVRTLYGPQEYQRFLALGVALEETATHENAERLNMLAGPTSGPLVPV